MTAAEPFLVRKILFNLGVPQKPILLLCDNTAAEFFLQNPIENRKRKYIIVHWHYCRELFADERLVVCRIDSNSQLGDVCTNMHSGEKMADFRNLLCLL
jgi:hypothetical protein